MFHLNPLVSIVILNWNGRKYLQQFLPSVLASTYQNLRIFVVDNASTDDSVAFLASHYPTVQTILLPENFGFAKGYNEGLKQINSDYYVLLNSDVEVIAGWVEPAVMLLESNKKIAACQPKLRQFEKRHMFEYAGAAGGWLDHYAYPFAKGRIFDVCEEDTGQYDQVEAIFWASGAAMFVRSEVWHKMGGFDDYFFAHQEEIDLCWRMQLAGYEIFSCPQSIVFHLGGGTLPKGNSMKVFLNFRNNLVMMAKNMKTAEAVWKISLRFLLDAVSAIKSLLSGEGTYFLAVIRAHFAFLYWLFFVRKIRSVYPDKVPLHGWLRKSIVWNHFALGKRRFSEIVLKET